MISEIELKAVRSKVGIKAISVWVEDVREPYEGPLEKLSSNFIATSLSTSQSTSWAGSIIGQYQIEQNSGAEPFIERATSSLVLPARDTTMIIPLNMDKVVRNLADHTLIIELEATGAHGNVQVRALLNVSALDTQVMFTEAHETK